MRRTILIHLIIGCLVVLIGAYAAMVLQQIAAELYRDSGIASYSPHEATLVLDDQGEIIARLYLENRELLRIEEVPTRVKTAFIGVEDHTFYEHHGFSVRGIARAMVRNLKAGGRVVEGGSTITQQLAKVLMGDLSRGYSRYLYSFLLAIEMERRLTKDDILEKYLNQICFGHGVYGLKAAARYYFSKPVDQLTLLEAACLAAVPKNPERYSPYNNRAECLTRAKVVLARLRELNMVSEEEYQASLAEALQLGSKQVLPQGAMFAPYFIDYIKQDLLTRIDKEKLYSGGLRIYTTLNRDMQKAAEEALLQTTDRQGAVLIIDPHSGQIKAMVGGRSYEQSKFNRAVQAQRQSGSSFKPFVYLSALLRGYTAATVLKDEPTTFPEFGNYKPQNYSRSYAGPITLQRALERSLNIPTVSLASSVGIDNVIETARKLGISSALTPGLALALGAGDVNLLEMTSAYCPLANKGVRCPPVAVRYVTDGEGRILNEIKDDDGRVLAQLNWEQPRYAVISEQHAYLITHIMQGVMTRGTAANCNLDRPCAGKTGTTDSEKSVWFIGFTPDLVCGVYIGNDNSTTLRRAGGGPVTGSSIPAPIWKKVMTRALANRPKTEFAVPSKIDFAQVCTTSGMLAVEGCPAERMAFLAGTQPTMSCTSCAGGQGLIPLNAEEIFYDEVGW